MVLILLNRDELNVLRKYHFDKQSYNEKYKTGNYHYHYYRWLKIYKKMLKKNWL